MALETRTLEKLNIGSVVRPHVGGCQWGQVGGRGQDIIELTWLLLVLKRDLWFEYGCAILTVFSIKVIV
jgi:hypothetical protein